MRIGNRNRRAALPRRADTNPSSRIDISIFTRTSSRTATGVHYKNATPTIWVATANDDYTGLIELVSTKFQASDRFTRPLGTFDRFDEAQAAVEAQSDSYQPLSS